jgi:hypothetical protein
MILELDDAENVYTGTDADKLAYAVAHQLLFMLEHGLTPSLVQIVVAGRSEPDDEGLSRSLDRSDRGVDRGARHWPARGALRAALHGGRLTMARFLTGAVTYSPRATPKEQQLLGLRDRIARLDVLMEQGIAPETADMMMRHWETKGAAFGHPWADWKPSTLRARISEGQRRRRHSLGRRRLARLALRIHPFRAATHARPHRASALARTGRC